MICGVLIIKDHQTCQYFSTGLSHTIRVISGTVVIKHIKHSFYHRNWTHAEQVHEGVAVDEFFGCTNSCERSKKGKVRLAVSIRPETETEDSLC